MKHTLALVAALESALPLTPARWCVHLRNATGTLVFHALAALTHEEIRQAAEWTFDDDGRRGFDAIRDDEE